MNSLTALFGHFPSAARGLPVLGIGALCSLWVGRYHGRWGRKVTFIFVLAMYLTYDVIGVKATPTLFLGSLCIWAFLCTIGPKDKNGDPK